MNIKISKIRCMCFVSIDCWKHVKKLSVITAGTKCIKLTYREVLLNPQKNNDYKVKKTYAPGGDTVGNTMKITSLLIISSDGWNMVPVPYFKCRQNLA
jgi:hypothetical protein